MRRLLTGVASAAALLLSVPTVASAAINVSFSGLSGAEYDTAGVFVLGDINFTATDDDGGGFDEVFFQLYDDGDVKFSDTYSLLVGLSGSFHFEVYYPGLVGTSAQGVGLYLTDTGGSGSVTIDPYDVPHYADPGQCQTDCGPVGGVPEPGTWAMLIMGFSAIGGALRASRRQRRTLAA